jgi:hypothetical protein
MLIATDPLSLLFIGCFLFGLLFVLASALLGNLGHGSGHIAHGSHIAPSHAVAHSGTALSHGTHVAHAGQAHGSQGSTANMSNNFFSSLFAAVNPISIALFLLSFGFFGYALHNTALLTLPFVLILAGVSGFIIAGLLLLMINRLFDNSVEPVAQDVTDRTGLLGRVSITVPENGLGEIIYISPAGMRKSIPARSIDGRKIERDQEVVVTNYQSGIAEIDTWDHFINQEGATAETYAPDDLDTLRALLDETDKSKQYVMKRDVPKE